MGGPLGQVGNALDSYDYRRSLRRLSRELSLAGNLDVLGGSLPATLIRLMNVRFASLLVHGAQGPRACATAGLWQPALLPMLVEASGAIQEDPGVVELAEGAGLELLVPLRTLDRAVGHLCLGPKATGEPFRAEDRALLTTLSGHLAAITRNTQLVDDLHQQVATLDTLNAQPQHAQEDERARMAADIHDEPLQTALHLLGLAGLYRRVQQAGGRLLSHSTPGAGPLGGGAQGGRRAASGVSPGPA